MEVHRRDQSSKCQDQVPTIQQNSINHQSLPLEANAKKPLVLAIPDLVRTSRSHGYKNLKKKCHTARPHLVQQQRIPLQEEEAHLVRDQDHLVQVDMKPKLSLLNLLTHSIPLREEAKDSIKVLKVQALDLMIMHSARALVIQVRK
jgi:hypothetical protein